MTKVYWTQKDGTVINIDDMTEAHAKNTLKMILGKIKTRKRVARQKRLLKEIELNGDMAQEFNDQQDSYNDPNHIDHCI